jgi:hypothetical protein
MPGQLDREELMARSENEHDFVEELVQLLASANAQAKITPARLARSTLYDPQYHIAVIACAMREHGEGSSHRILAPWLKVLQFVAARPTLVDPFIDYVESRKANFELWKQMPRGYLGDETHDAVVDLLVASGILRKSGDAVEGSLRYSTLGDLAMRIDADNLFAAERSVLKRLRSVKATKVLLGAP